MAAVLDIDPAVALPDDQVRALAIAAQTLSDGWNVLVRTDPGTGQLVVRVVGDGFG